MGSLTDQSRVKGALRIPAGVTTYDARIAQIVDEAEAELLAMTSLSAWGETSYTETYDVPGIQDSIVLNRFPVLSVAAATYVDSGVALVDGTDFQWDESGRFSLLEGLLLPLGRRQVQVTYTAGCVATGGTTNASLVRAATLQAARQWNLEPMAGFSSVDARPVRRAVAPWKEDAVQAEIDRVMARYRRAT